MKYFTYLITLFLLTFNQVQAQDIEGAIKTKDGFLLYFNYEHPFTIELKGDVNLSKYPLLTIDGNLFEFVIGYSNEFGNEEKNILLNYMKWESDYISEFRKMSIVASNKFINIDNRLINLWSYVNPVFINEKETNDKQFFADIYNDERVYRLSAVMFKGSDKEAENFLLDAIVSIRFYKDKIDVQKLSNAIMKGELYID